jgi:small subunit ribosomal protein SAe
MSSNTDVFRLRDEDVAKMLVSHVHLGSTNLNHQMEQYIWRRRTDGQYIINVKKTWEKIVLAARAIAAVDNASDVSIISARPYAQRGILKYAAHTGASAIAGRFTPGAFTNQIQKAFKEPRLLIISDPRIDHQAITEASFVNIPVIAFTNSDSPMKLIDIAIPCNNKGQKAIGLMLWMLAREVLLIRGRINRQTGFNLDDKEIMPDLYFYRDPEEEEVKEPEVVAVEAVREDWGGEVANQQDDLWAGQAGGAPAPSGQTIDFATLTSAATGEVTDWAQQVEMQQWNNQGGAAAAPAPAAEGQWGASAEGANKW